MSGTTIESILAHPATLFCALGAKGLLNWIPDEIYLKAVYRIRTGQSLNIKNPKTLNEKLQWLKIHDRKQIYTRMVDKYEAKKIVSDAIGQEYIIPTLGVWDKFDDIDFDTLPNRFVIKCTHDSGGLVICRDKKILDIEKAKDKINKSMKHNYYCAGREWPYKNVKPRIIVEEYMEENGRSGKEKGLTDYKFFCMNGIPKFLYVSRGLEHHPTAEISFYDMNGNEMPFHRSDYKPYHNAIMPSNYDQLKQTAEKLAKYIDCPFVRIDLYSINGRVYFSEITFSPCSGMIPFEPMTADEELGKELKLLEEGMSK